MSSSASPPAAGGSTAGPTGSLNKEGRGVRWRLRDVLTEGHPRRGHHHPSPDLCGGLSAALLQPPHDSQRAKKYNATPLGQCLPWLLLARVPKPRLLAASTAPQFSQTSSPTIPLLFCYAPNPVLGPLHMLLFDPGKLLPQPFPQSAPSDHSDLGLPVSSSERPSFSF